ncbi:MULTISPECIES: hypothetical protein [unclassified Bradyrhizobium]|uniref:hypothetical protein n=1 Tax=unclassified Bradyrhizobium TaxID=2631580 RepID=UPI002915D357|nr:MULTISPECIES: hypothetical protein [unclassified Bradyrhizobium]
MSVRRVVIGRRADGTFGAFVSKAGFDALVTPDANLLLNISSKVSFLLQLGLVGASQVVPLGLSRSPVVMVTSENSLGGTLANYNGPGGPTRPSPLAYVIPNGSGGFSVGLSPASSATINGNGASVTINCSVGTVYAVYSQAFT